MSTQASPRRASWPERVGLPAALALCAFAIYLATLAPGLTWAHEGADGGDLIAAAYTLGIPHPTGYPLYVLLGKLFSFLPVGNVAFRLNLMSASCAALAVFAFYRWVREWLAREQPAWGDAPLTVAAAMASLFLAFSRLFWSQALIAEVYALNALLVVVVLYIFQHWTEGCASGALLAFMLGIGLGNHLTLLFLLPPMALYIGSGSRHCLRPSRAVIAGAAFLAGLGIYLYLPLRAAARPYVNWGDPVALDRFFWMISGALYRHYVFALPLDFLPLRLAKWAGDFVWQFGPWGVMLGLLGLWALAAASRRQALLTGGILALYSAYAIGYNTADSFVYLIPAYTIWAFWIACGALHALKLAEVAWETLPRARRVPLIILAVALPLLAVPWNGKSLSLRNDREATDRLEAILSALPPQAIAISASDEHTFALWYAQQVEGSRPDLLVLDRDLLPYGWYRDNILPRYPDVQVPADEGDTFVWLTRFLDANLAARPVFLTDSDERLMARYRVEAVGALFHLLPR